MTRLFANIVLHRGQIDKSAKFIINRLLIIFFFALLTVYASQEVVDLDLWLHLKTGEVITQTRTVPLADIFSFSCPKKPWINHAWLFQVIAHLFHKNASFDGLIAMQNIVLLSTFFLLLFFGLKGKNHIFVFVVLYLTLLSSSYRFMIRPDIFSLFFLAAYLLVLKKYIDQKSRLIFLLPILQILWTNMHGFFFTGPLIIAIILTGEGLKHIPRLPYEWKDVHRLDRQQVTTLLTVLVLTLLATIANPHGWRGAIYPLTVISQISGKGSIVFQYIQELAKPILLKNIFQVQHFFFFKALILSSLFSFRFNARRIDITHIILWLLALGFSLLAIRNVAYFNIIAAAIIFNNIEEALQHKKTYPGQFRSKILKNSFYYIFAAFLFYYPLQGAEKFFKNAAFSFDTYELKSTLWGLNRQRYPEKAVDFLLKNKFPGIMLNDFNSGAYLIGRAFPERRVFIDGRTEFYGPEFFARYVDISAGKREAVEKALSQYNIQGFFLTNPNNDLHLGLIRFLAKNPLWPLVYFDESALIFLKNTADNSNLINQYRIDLKTWNPPEPEFLKLGIAFRSPTPYLQRARILNALGFYESAAREAQIALDIMPNNAQALSYMADHLIEKKEYHRAFKYVRNSLVYAPGNTHMRCQLALLYHKLNDTEKALKTLDGFLKKGKESPEACYTKALIIKEADPKGAKELLQKAANITPKDPKYHAALGEILEKEEDPEAAKKEWLAAYEYDGSSEELKNKLKHE